MKKLLITMLIFTLSTPSLAASAMDEDLLDAGAVDKNYVYIDYDLASKMFQKTTNNYAKLLPVMMNSFTQVQGALFSPSESVLVYRVLIDFDDSSKKVFIDSLNSNDTLALVCKGYFLNNEFMLANDYSISYRFNDINHHLLTTIEMDTKKCIAAIELKDNHQKAANN